jgi:hypothetical protein
MIDQRFMQSLADDMKDYTIGEEPAPEMLLAAGPARTDEAQAFVGTRLNVPRAGQPQPTTQDRERLAVGLLDSLAGALRGAAAQTLGLPGDIRSIIDMIAQEGAERYLGQRSFATTEEILQDTSVRIPGTTTDVPFPPVLGADVPRREERQPAVETAQEVGTFLPAPGIPEAVIRGGKAIGRAARAAKGNPSGILLQDAAGADVPVMKAPKVESKAFKNWFGDSKAVDEANKPIVVYHARRGDFEAFDPNMGEGKTADTGTFFSASPEVAATYNTSSEHNIVPAYLSLKNPLIVDFNGANWNNAGKDALVKLPDGTDDDLLSYFGDWVDDVVSTDDVARLARLQGKDGVIIRNVVDHGPAGRFSTEEAFKPTDIYVAFKPEQIKSVMNKGTFDPDDPRMLYGAGGAGVAAQQEENK